VTLSFYAQVSTARNINVTMALATTADAVWTGTWTTFSTTSVAIGTSMARYTVTATVPSNMKTMNIGFGSGGTNFAAGTTLNITGVQLELGSVATPFEKRPIGTELALCQRYYFQDATVGVDGYGAAGMAVARQYTLPVPMRTASALTQTGSGTASNISGTTFGVDTATSSNTNVNLFVTAVAAGRTYLYRPVQFSAEL
jgi:hypothetical protein